jgi:hypothetical protein
MWHVNKLTYSCPENKGCYKQKDDEDKEENKNTKTKKRMKNVDGEE